MYRVVNMSIGTCIYTHTYLVIMLPPRPKEYQKTQQFQWWKTSIYAIGGG